MRESNGQQPKLHARRIVDVQWALLDQKGAGLGWWWRQNSASGEVRQKQKEENGQRGRGDRPAPASRDLSAPIHPSG
jgi:hypothetical protein